VTSKKAGPLEELESWLVEQDISCCPPLPVLRAELKSLQSRNEMLEEDNSWVRVRWEQSRKDYKLACSETVRVGDIMALRYQTIVKLQDRIAKLEALLKAVCNGTNITAWVNSYRSRAQKASDAGDNFEWLYLSHIADALEALG